MSVDDRRFGLSVAALCVCAFLFVGVFFADSNDETMMNHHKHHSHGSGFQFSSQVQLFHRSVSTESFPAFFGVCLCIFAMSVCVEALRRRSNGSRGRKALQHVATVAVSYLV